MDLDPKGANNQIKEAIDKRYLPDDEEPVTPDDYLYYSSKHELGGGCTNHIHDLKQKKKKPLQFNEVDLPLFNTRLMSQCKVRQL